MPDAPELIIDVGDKQQSGLLLSFDSSETTSLMRMVKDTGLTRRFRFVQKSNSLDRPWDDYPVDTATKEWAVGLPDVLPVGGLFTLQFGAFSATMTDLSPTITAAALQTAMNGNPTISAAGGVVVTLARDEFVVTWNNVGARALFVVLANSLTPASTITVLRVVTGDASTREVQVLRLAQEPWAYTAAFTPSAAGTAVQSTVRAGTDAIREIQRITLSPGAYGGAFNLTFGLPEKTIIGAAANTGTPGAVAGTYFLLQDKDGPVAVWAFVSTETQPNTGNFNRAIKYTIVAGDTAAQVATAIQTALAADSQFTGTTVSGSTVSVIDSNPGTRAVPSGGTATAAGITVTRKQAGLSISAPIPYNASPEAVEAEMGAAFTVAKPSANQWDFTSVILGDMPAMTVDDAGLLFPIYYTATLRLNALALHQGFASTSADEITVTMEVRVTQVGEDPLVVFHDDVVIERNLIDLGIIGFIAWDAVQPIVSFANAAAVAAATPDFIGQLALDLATGNYYWGAALTPGGFGGDFLFQNSVTTPTGLIDFLTVNNILTVGKTITPAGTTGARTINKIAGAVNFAAGAASLVVTNSLVTTSSVIQLTIATNDANANGLRYTPGNGSFTIRFTVVPAAETRVDFLVLN